MPDQKNVLKGTPLPPKEADLRDATDWKVNPADAISALNQLMDLVNKSVQVHETESTKREQLRAYRETEVARIKYSRKILKEYFDRIFEERRETHQRLFASLDLALESGDIPAMQTIVGGIVEVAKTSPLLNIGDIGELRRAMDDPKAVFEL